jgi:hypothetical protein
LRENLGRPERRLDVRHEDVGLNLRRIDLIIAIRVEVVSPANLQDGSDVLGA